MVDNLEAFASFTRLFFLDVLFNVTTELALKDKTAGFRKQISENVVVSKATSKHREIGVSTETA